MTEELPTIMTNTVMNNMYNGITHWVEPGPHTAGGSFMPTFDLIQAQTPHPMLDDEDEEEDMPQKKAATMRLVRVFVVDPDENLPMADRILVETPEEMTELTDQELFMELGIAPYLKTHNEMRKTMIDKKASKLKEKDVMLEPIRIRDLKMAVVVIAEF